MKIIKSKNYLKDYKKKIEYKHLNKEMNRVSEIERLILDSSNLRMIMINPLRLMYGIEQKKGKVIVFYSFAFFQFLC